MEQPRETAYSVTGSVLRSKLEAHESLFGASAVQGLKIRIGRDIPRNISQLEWYPFEILEKILADIQTHQCSGQVEKLSAIGAETARILLTSTYKPLTAGSNWPLFMQTASRLHSRYYNRGEMLVTFADDGVCRVDLVGAPRYPLADLHVAGGFYHNAAIILGAKVSTYRLLVDKNGAHFEI